MGQESFEESRNRSHVLHDEPKVVIWSAQQIRANDGRQVVSSHMILLFVVDNTEWLLERKSIKRCIIAYRSIC